MNKSALKSFATKARIELLERVELQALKIGISKDEIDQASIESSDAIILNGKPLEETERKQRDKLIHRIEEIGYERVMEETAYTWFNRFVALRFMEVNNYLPTRVRVLSSDSPDSTEPDMMREALELNLDIDKQYIYDLKMENKQDELFKYLIQLHCNDLNKYMPFMFETLEDYMMILFPEGLLGTDSFLKEMTDLEVISEEDWGQIEIVGWLYQFYIADEKDRVFAAKGKYKAEEIPFATQLFTPDWIVQYMVQNSLGRYWVEAHPEHEDLTDDWDYFIEHEQEDFAEKIAPYVNKELNVEDIKCYDPAMGSGHILVYMFEVLYEIYSKAGYVEREIPKLIFENNLYGLDIDDRAFQLAGFSLVMKAQSYNRRFLRTIQRDGLRLNLAAIQETNNLTTEDIAYFIGSEDEEKIKPFFEQFNHAKTIGSLLKVSTENIETIETRLQDIENNPATDLLDDLKRDKILSLVPSLIKQAKIMDQQYDILVTNPPYMGRRSMNKDLTTYLDKNYPDSKADLFATFMELDHNIKKNGFYSMINQHSWMFLSSYEKVREKLINNKHIDTMLHLGSRAFEEIGGEVVQSTTFTTRKVKISDVSGTYIRLVDYNSASEKNKNAIKAIKNPDVTYRYTFEQGQFDKIPESPIAYWLSEIFIENFDKYPCFGQYADTKKGILTGDDKRFVRAWFEVSSNKVDYNISNYDEMVNKNIKWFPITGGGTFRKWYGNIENVVNLENDAYEIKYNNKRNFRLRENKYYFLESLSWTEVTSNLFSLRYIPEGVIFGNGGPSCFVEQNLYYFLGLLNTNVAMEALKTLAPTINFGPEQIKRIPCIILKDKKVVEEISKECVAISRYEWDSFETSWDFENHPILVHKADTIEKSFNQWADFAEEQFNQLKENEEKLNEIFIEIYGLEDELTPDVDEKDVTVRKADLERDVKSFISYAVGCSFGRYSLDEDGLIYAGGDFDASRYSTFPADDDNIIPVLDAAYFEDDIVNRFIQFVKVTYGEETLDKNLQFVAEAIGKRVNETAREAIRRYFMNNFYKDHTQTYKKHPIYWLFSSGKEKAFNCLIYMHRYDKTTLSRIRTDYLHDVQTRYETRRLDLIALIDAGDATAKDKRELKDIEKKIEELKQYDEKLHHLADMQIEIDLDDGVKENYKKFDGLLVKI